MTSRFLVIALLHCLLTLNMARSQEAEVGAFTGAEDGEGLDLSTADGGEFVYAINIGGPEIQVGEVTFTEDVATPGLEWEAVNHIPAWDAVNDFGGGADDAALATVLHSIRWSPAPGSVRVVLSGITPGVEHRLQLLFAEKCCDRGWDITVDGELAADDFSARALAADLTQAAFFRYDFLPTSEVVTIDLNGTEADFPDRNPILSGVTLERLSETADDPNLAVRTRLGFGQVPATPAVTLPLTLRNAGASEALVVNEVRVTGIDAGHFTVGALPGTVEVGGSVELAVSFDAAGESGLFQGVLEVLSNDSGDPVVMVELTASVVNRNGPAVHLALDEDQGEVTARDVSGNDRHGSYQREIGQVDLGRPALAGGTAAAFSGGGHVVVPGGAFDEALESFAVSLWLEADAFGPGLQTLFGKGDAESPTFALLTFGQTLAWFTGGEAPEFASGDVLQPGVKHHVAVIHDDTVGARRVTVYLDGEVVAESTDPVVFGDALGLNLVVGAYNGALPFAGVMDDVQLYDRLLSAADIAFLREHPGEALGGEVDSDGDGLTDTREAELGTAPLLADSDGDGLGDGAEVNVHGTDPLLKDSDGDGFGDGVELRKGSDPLDPGILPSAALEVGTFTGGDPGEGLDMEGDFVYAVNAFGPGGGRVGDALFTDDAVAGVTITAANSILAWHAPEYGDSPNDNALEVVLQSIRWDTAPLEVELADLEIGRRYVLQLLFAESCCQRGWDIVINGELEADEFSPDLLHQRSASKGVVATYTFTAESEDLNITFANDEADFPDRNPILNGFTLKREGTVSDSDGDGLLDSWERAFLGGLNESGDGDPDGDGLSNLAEQEAKTDPRAADSDADGLNDGEELLAAAPTDPLRSDTDGDGLTDGSEVMVHGTDPLVADTDGDGFADSVEIFLGSDARAAADRPSRLPEVGVFTGGDVGEGLDLQGDFLYAINLLGEGGLQVQDASFTDDTVAGFSYDQPNEILDWHPADYGDSANDDALEIVMQSIRWNAGPVQMELTGLVPGRDYQLQLLFAESCCDRGWDILVEGAKVFDDFNVQRNQGGPEERSRGVVTTVAFTAARSSLSIAFLNEAPAFPDNNPILNGLTLEDLGEGGVVVPGPGDSDGDGVPDVEEALAGTDPDDAGDYLRITETVRLGGAGGVRVGWSAVSGKRYRLEYSVDMRPGSWIEVQSGLEGAGGFGEAEDTDQVRTGASQGYYRIQVEP